MARRKMSTVNRAINFGLFLLAFSRPISILIRKPSSAGAMDIVNEATGGLASGGKFNPAAVTTFYGPVAAAFVLFEIKKMAKQKFRF